MCSSDLMLLIPARIRFKALLGIQSNERNGFLGAMAMMTLTRAIASRIKQGVGKLADAFSDARKSRMYGEMADVDREEEESYLSAAEGKSSPNNRLSEDGNNLSRVDGGQENGVSSAETGSEKPEDQNNAPVLDREPDDIAVPQTADYAQEGLSYGNFKERTDFPSDISGADDAGTGTPSQNKNDLLRSIDGAMNQSQENLDKLKEIGRAHV